ncbi:MAG: FtsK/SpoIIIE domain-containing protein [Verrucomicrobia bacterium]|nr:FtsK/SpoIIIE domain-containing protein [Verrucomicrobiota bacterium]
MSSHTGVAQAIEWLNSLKGTVHDVAEREGKLDREFRARINLLRQRRQEAIDEQATQLAADLAAADASFQAARVAAETKYERRVIRINEARQLSLQRRLEEIDNTEGLRKHKLQAETLQAKRHREASLAAAEATCGEFKSQLNEDYQALLSLEMGTQKCFKGYARFVGFLSSVTEAVEPDSGLDEHQVLAQFRELFTQSQNDLGRFRKRLLPGFFRYLPLWLVFVLGQIPLVPLLQLFGIKSFSFVQAAESIAGCLVAGVILYFVGKRQSEPLALAIARALRQAHKLHESCLARAEARLTQERERIENEYQSKNQWIAEEWNRAVDAAAGQREACPQQLETRAERALARNENRHGLTLEGLERVHGDTNSRLKKETEARIRERTDLSEKNEAKLQADYQALLNPLRAEWKTRVQPLYDGLAAAQAEAARLFPPWQDPSWENWAPPPQFEHAVQCARMEVDVEKLSEGTPKDPQLALPGPARFALPLLLTYPRQGSILLEAIQGGREDMLGALNNIILRLLSSAPAGRLSFSIVDPVGLGQSFSGIMHLADHAEHLINSRIWTHTLQIEQRFADLNEHMEKVIQMYLRNEYATIVDYNEQAGNIAEKYHFLVVADFPVNFSDLAAKRLLSIATSGARCGVFTLIHWDRRQPLPQDFAPEELRKSSVCITCKGKEFILAGHPFPGATLVLETPPAPEFAIGFIQKVGLASRDSNRVEVPFSHVAPPETSVWTAETVHELRVPVGRTGATKLQYLAIGKGTCQHALLAGKTGSGKSTLFHVIITNLSLWCSPEQVEFYLIDFKKGVEFKCYATHHLPHARVVAIESDREFGLSVLQRLDEELKRRGDLFRKLGVQDIAGYKRAGGTEPIPRSLLIIDEFQEFFTEDDKIAQTASLLLDRIVRQGRAFGLHVLLGSQTLGGAYTVARTTLGQMVIRIALQCNEADAYLIMDENNPAPRLLSRPGEAIYNDTAGTLEGNSPFQVVWLPDAERDTWLSRVRALADRSPGAYPGPIIYEGNAPADVRENPLLQQLLEAESVTPAVSARIWLGAPNSIKGPTEVVFQRHSGNNLLMVGQRDEAVLAILSIALLSLAAQYRPETARFILLDGTAPGSRQREFLEQVLHAIPHRVTLVKQNDLPEILGGLVAEMKKRADDEQAAQGPPVFLFLHGLQKFNKLRYEEDFSFSANDAGASSNPSALLNLLLCEGTRLGFHVIATCDTYNNVNRFLSRKAFSEFEMRVLFQMSANDSASLIDNPKASTLGLHRALFFNEQEGYLETFRPYALPERPWLDQAARHLARLLA